MGQTGLIGFAEKDPRLSCGITAGKAGEFSGRIEAHGGSGEAVFSMVCNVDYLHYSAFSIEIIKTKKCIMVVHTCNSSAGVLSQEDLKFEALS